MRLFVGITVSDQAREELARVSRELEGCVPGRFSPPELYHMTLAFIGEGDPARVTRVLNGVAREQSPALLSLDKLGFFGKRENAILYAGVRGTGALLSLDKKLRAGLQFDGVCFDPKPFRAHITLARQARLPDILPAVAPVRFLADRLTLFNSARVGGELRYEPVFAVKFCREGNK